MTFSTDSIFQRNSEIIASEIENETVMMDKDFETYFGLAKIGTRIWQLLENEISLQTICEKLVDEYDVSLEQCIADVTPFIASLLENEMVHQK